MPVDVCIFEQAEWIEPSDVFYQLEPIAELNNLPEVHLLSSNESNLLNEGLVSIVFMLL